MLAKNANEERQKKDRGKEGEIRQAKERGKVK